MRSVERVSRDEVFPVHKHWEEEVCQNSDNLEFISLLIAIVTLDSLVLCISVVLQSTYLCIFSVHVCSVGKFNHSDAVLCMKLPAIQHQINHCSTHYNKVFLMTHSCGLLFSM